MDITDIGVSGCLLMVIVFAVSRWYLTRQPWKKHPPGPFSFPVLGSMPFLKDKDIRKAFIKLGSEYGPIARLDLGVQTVIVVNGFEAIREILVDNGTLFTYRPDNHIIPVDYFGFVNSRGQVWKEHKRFILHSLKNMGFAKPRMEKVIEEELQTLVVELATHQNQPFNVRTIFMKSSANITLMLALRERKEYDDHEMSEYLENFYEVLFMAKNSDIVNAFPFLKYLPGDLIGHWKFIQQMDVLASFINKLINKRSGQSPIKNTPDDFIKMYMREIEHDKINPNPSFTKTRMIWTMQDILGAGSDTVSTFMLWNVLFMIQHPGIQHKIFAEIQDVIGQNRTPCLSDRSKLPYTSAVISETLRLADLLPLSLPHSPVEDTTFRGYHLDKGCSMILNFHSVHRDPAIWPDPEKFCPERFLNDRGEYKKRDELIAFSLGKRNCLGEVLGQAELFLFLTTLVQEFEFHAVEGAILPGLNDGELGISYRPGPYDVIIKARIRSE